MPRLPTADDLGQRPAPQPRGGISRLQLSTPRRGAEAQAEIQFGNAVKGLGDTLGILGLQEKAKVDGARSQEAYSQYQDATLDMEYGEQNGFDKIRGGDAVKGKLVEDYRARREVVARGIRDGLESNDQRIAFDKQASIVDRQFDARLYSHVAEQTQIYQKQVSEGVMATERRSAALNYGMPGQVEMSLARIDHEIERMARINGISDPDVINNQKAIAGTQLHADVINQMLIKGKDSAALAYYNGVKEELTPEAIVILGAKVQAAAVDGDSLRTADTVWKLAGPKGLEEPPRLDIMEALIRERLSDKPVEMKAAIADIRSRVVAHKDAGQEMKASNKATVLQQYHDGADLDTLQTMPEYQALDGTAKTEVRDYVVQRGRGEDQQARMDASYRDAAKAKAGFSAYWEISNPQVLSTMSESRILSMEPTLGQTLTQELMQAKRKLSSPENVKAATMDAESFNVIAANAGLPAYDKKASTEQKEQLGRLRNEVEGAIDVEQRRSGKTLNREEKEKIMQSMVDKKVMVDDWGSDSQYPAPIIKPEMRSQIYVPIDKVDGEWLKGAMNLMRSRSLVPGNWDDAAIRRNNKGRLERAYAISITGGTMDEVSKALAGTDEGIRQ